MYKGSSVNIFFSIFFGCLDLRSEPTKKIGGKEAMLPDSSIFLDAWLNFFIRFKAMLSIAFIKEIV
jgi:hypothetical protein